MNAERNAIETPWTIIIVHGFQQEIVSAKKKETVDTALGFCIWEFLARKLKEPVSPILHFHYRHTHRS